MPPSIRHPCYRIITVAFLFPETAELPAQVYSQNLSFLIFLSLFLKVNRSIDEYLHTLHQLGEEAERCFSSGDWKALRQLSVRSLEAADGFQESALPPVPDGGSPLAHAHASAHAILRGDRSRSLSVEACLGNPGIGAPCPGTAEGGHHRPTFLAPGRLEHLRACSLAFARQKGVDLGDALTLLPYVFYRNRRAYLLARGTAGARGRLMLLALTVDRGEPVPDAVLLTEEEITPVFEFSRSTLIPRPGASLGFLPLLEELMPAKDRWQLLLNTGFLVLGRALLLQAIRRHLARTAERFTVAPGTPGMVMVVFHLPGFPVVFKVIKDYPDPPKNVGRLDVLRKYRLVAEHDRAGRLADSHLFTELSLPRASFDPALLELLRERVALSLHENGSSVVFREVLVERKMTPLNLLLDKTPAPATKLLDEYAAAIMDLARANIFPGDLLPKNFGVTRFGRVVFYDYDEVERLTTCSFRKLPDEEDALHLSIGPHDVFPEEWIPFLCRSPDDRAYLLGRHPDLFRPEFWNACRSCYLGDDFFDLFPYQSQRQPKHKQAP